MCNHNDNLLNAYKEQIELLKKLVDQYELLVGEIPQLILNQYGAPN